MLLPLAASAALGLSLVSAQHANMCSPSELLPILPEGQSNLTVPVGEVTRFVGLGRGIQNYTCTNKTWTSAGAVARLFDVSCLPLATFPEIPQISLIFPLEPRPSKGSDKKPRKSTISPTPALDAIQSSAAQLATGSCDPFLETPGYLGLHTFVIVNGTLAPKFDFTATQGAGQYVLSSKAGSVASSNKEKDVAWLELKGFEGGLATTIFRVNTAGGQPPTECDHEGARLSVQYGALYFFLS